MCTDWLVIFCYIYVFNFTDSAKSLWFVNPDYISNIPNIGGRGYKLKLRKVPV